jgi:hypothetical protein
VDGLGAERVYLKMWVDKPPHHIHLVLYSRCPGEKWARWIFNSRCKPQVHPTMTRPLAQQSPCVEQSARPMPEAKAPRSAS